MLASTEVCEFVCLRVCLWHEILMETVKQKQSRWEPTESKGFFKASNSRSVITCSYALFKHLLTKLSGVSCLSTDIPARACLCGPSVAFHLEKGDNRSGTMDLCVGSQTPAPIVCLGNEMLLYY